MSYWPMQSAGGRPMHSRYCSTMKLAMKQQYFSHTSPMAFLRRCARTAIRAKECRSAQTSIRWPMTFTATTKHTWYRKESGKCSTFISKLMLVWKLISIWFAFSEKDQTINTESLFCFKRSKKLWWCFIEYTVTIYIII